MHTKQYKIVHLPKEQWENVPIPMRYHTEEYFDVKMEKTDRLYQKHWEKAYAWGIVEKMMRSRNRQPVLKLVRKNGLTD